MARIPCPVYGFYAGNDGRISLTVPQTGAAMKRAGKAYESVVYPGAGHGFMRVGDAPAPRAPAAADDAARQTYQQDLVAYQANRQARDAAWARWKKILSAL